MYPIFLLTVKESIKKKNILILFIISTLFCLTSWFMLGLDYIQFGKEYIIFMGNKEGNDGMAIDEILGRIQAGIAIVLYIIGLSMSIFATSDNIPSLLKTGSIDLIVTKPISRFNILAGRFFGSLAVVSANILYLILFSWIIFSAEFEIWNFNYLYSALIIILVYSALFTLVMFFGFLTKNGMISMMISFAVIFISPVLMFREYFYTSLSSELIRNLVDFTYYIIPKVSDLGEIIINLNMKEPVETLMPVWSSVIFGVIMFYASYLVFKRKDF